MPTTLPPAAIDSQPPFILIVEDNKELAELIHDYLVKQSFRVAVIHDGLLATDAIINQQPDLLILDIMLPNKSGMDICREVRADFKGAILMLTALDEDMDQILGLELGADDYIIKPVQPRLLLTRIRTLLRRIKAERESSDDNGVSNSTSRSNIHIGPLNINLRSRIVSLNNHNVTLTTAEFELLLLLAQDTGRVVEREMIVQQLRGFDYDGINRSIDRRISRLRKKLHCDGDSLIKTVRGQGYQLCIDEL